MDHEQATTFISELTEGVYGDRIPTFFMRGNHESAMPILSVCVTILIMWKIKLMPLLTGETPVIVMLDCGEDKPDDHWYIMA